MGTPDFAVPSLQKLVASSHNIALVVTGSDKRRGRKQKPTPTPVKAEAQKSNLDVWQTDDVRDGQLHQKLTEVKPDLIVVVAFKILPESLLEIPQIGAINLHASLLPKYRGAAPIHHAVINGETETGCSVFFLNKGVDTGKIIDQTKTEIGPEETTGEVYHRLMNLGSDLLVSCVDAIAKNEVSPVTQDENKATPAPKIYTNNCRIDFSQPAPDVHNFIRGLSPFPGAWTTLNGKRLNIYRSRISDKQDTPGRIIHQKDNVFVACSEGAVELVEVQLEGRKRMSGDELFRGFTEEPGYVDR